MIFLDSNNVAVDLRFLTRIAMHQERTNKHANDDAVPDGAVPAYLLDREGVSRAKVLSNTVKQKRKEKAGKWDVPIPKVCVDDSAPLHGRLPWARYCLR